MKNPAILRDIMTYGLYLGLAAIAIPVIMHILDVLPVGIVLPLLLSAAHLAIYYMGIHLAMKSIKEQRLHGMLPYWDGVWLGVLVALCASIIMAFYSYIQNAIIDPGYMARALEAQKVWMYDFLTGRGVPEQVIYDALDRLAAEPLDRGAVRTVGSGILTGTVGGAILSLIAARILRTRAHPQF